jgi:hypothetical protein
MKAYLLTADDCQPCQDLKEQLKDLIAKGEIEEVNFASSPERVTEMMQKYGANLPSLLIVSNDGELIASA